MRLLAFGALPAALLLFVLTGCGNAATTAVATGWKEKPMRFARSFRILEQGSGRMLLTFGPGGNTDTTGIFVLPGNTTVEHLPAGAVLFRKPLRRVALQSTTHASFITAIGLANAVVGCAHAGQLLDTALVGRVRSGAVKEIGAAAGVDRERVIALAPDALLTYPFGADRSVGSIGNIPEIPVSEYLEAHPLGRAEWLRAFGVLFGKEALADSLFNAVAERYEKAVASIPAGEARPRVFFGSAWKGAWTVPAGNSYMARLIGDAGGRYLFAQRKAEGNINVDLEKVLLVGSRADRWGGVLHKVGRVTAADLAGGDSRILRLPVFKKRGCFYANSAVSDLFGRAVLEPDVVLEDLIGIFHPGLRDGRQPVYFRPLQ